MRLIFLDTETTGLTPEHGGRIIEIACIEMIDGVLTGRQLHHILNPEHPIPELVSEITGFYDAMVFDEPRFSDIAPQLVEFVGGEIARQQPLQALFSDVPYLGAFVSGPPVGIGILSAGIILAIMIIPFIAAVMRDVFEVTPTLLKESAYGLGATTWEVVSKVVLPYTKAGVIGGIMLGLGRAIGETMAVTFVIGNFNQLDSLSMFQAANSITSALANEFAEAGAGLHQAALMYLGLVLFFITFVILTLSKLLLAQLKKKEGAKS